MVSRRELLGSAVLGAAVAVLDPVRARAAVASIRPGSPETPEDIAADETWWFEIQRAFTMDRSLVNLNNGGVSPSPGLVQEAMKRHLDYANSAPSSYALWQVQEPQKEGTRRRLARAFGCDPEEIAITRNASEGLQTCQLGFNLERGDEVLAMTQDYPRMLATFDQRARREGIVVTKIRIPIPAEDPAEVVELYRKAITPRTKLILVSHLVNLTGQILPVRQLVELGRERGIPVIVDGAHTFAHFDFDQADLDCDYYATSLHKWLFAPHGTGMLYVRRDRIPGLWPLMAAPLEMTADIRKYEEIGTHPAANHLAIAEALTFHDGIGPKRKEARLRYLRDRWANRLLAHGGVKLHTSLKPGLSCGVATVQIPGVDTPRLARHLWDRHRILVTPIVHPEFEGLRVTPSVYTTLEEVDRFCEAMEEVVAKGLPA